MGRPKILIGTSGWNYWDWKTKFYPEGLPSKEWLSFYSRQFKTVEINYSFYHLPRPATFENWARTVSDDFIFSVKASRFITHIKRLKGVKRELKKFLTSAAALKEKLGPVLFQLPPGFKTNLKLLEEFLKGKGKSQRWAFEFRHESWFVPEVFKILEKHNTALVVADSPDYPCEKEKTADFAYLRFHGSKVLFHSEYTRRELESWAKLISKWAKRGEVYVYFNNTFQGVALENAEMLKEMLGNEV